MVFLDQAGPAALRGMPTNKAIARVVDQVRGRVRASSVQAPRLIEFSFLFCSVRVVFAYSLTSKYWFPDDNINCRVRGRVSNKALYSHARTGIFGYDDSKMLRFIVVGDSENFMHKDIRLENVYVRNSQDLEQAELAMGGFSGAQIGVMTVS